MHYESVIRFPVMYVGIDDSEKILVRALLALSVRRDWDCFRLDLSASVVRSLITHSDLYSFYNRVINKRKIKLLVAIIIL